jgi:hypothetical protein
MKTPYQLRILLDVYTGAPISVNQGMPLFADTMREMINDGWIRSTPTVGEYGATQKLTTFMEHVMKLPDPVQEWRMPFVPQVPK